MVGIKYLHVASTSGKPEIYAGLVVGFGMTVVGLCST